MIVNLALVAISSLALHYYFKFPPSQTIIIALALALALVLTTGHGALEGFMSGTDDNTRYVRFGDRITFWTHKNRFIRMHRDRFVDSSSYLSDPSEIPRTWVWELFKIEDANDNRYMIGSQTPVRYGDKVYLRSWLAYGNNLVWVSPGDNGYVQGRNNRKGWEVITLESPDIAGQNGQPIKYGDSIYLKTWRNQYITHPEGGSGYARMKQTPTKDSSCVFRIYDDYGQAQRVDWATRGTATQDDQYGGYTAANAINGNSNTFSHTQSKQNAWWQVELPRDINVSDIIVTNRKDCCKERLQNFDLILLDSDGKAVYSQYFKDTKDKYELSGINRTGRVVKVQLRGKNFLHLAKVEVYGTPINYSTTMETPVVADLITTPFDMSPDTGKQFHHDSIPYIGKSNSFSITTFIKPQAGNTGTRNIISKGNLSVTLEEGRTVSVHLTTARGQAKLKVNTALTQDKWNHIAMSIRPTVSPDHGWIYGEFSSKPVGITQECCYVVHPQRGEYYQLKEQGDFAKATKHTWAAGVVNGMKYLGELSSSSNVPILTIYINGNLDGVHKLDSNVKMTNSPLIVGGAAGAEGAEKGMIGQIHGLRVYNYDISKETAYRDSRSQHNAQTLKLVRSETDGGTPVVIDANILPTIQNEVSVSYWIKPGSTSGKWQPIFIYGAGTAGTTDRVMGMWFTPEGKLHTSANIVGGVTAGIKDVKYDIKPSIWYHVTLTLDDRTQAVYINGQRISAVELPGDVNYSVYPISIGGFVGKIKDFRFHNYALSKDEVRAQMGVHPDYKEQETVQRIWHEQGCTTNLFDDFESNADLVKLVKAGNEAAVESKLKSIKVEAHKGDTAKLKQCYGPYASELFAKLQKSGELLQHMQDSKSTISDKKCLPTAPFTCKDRTINDFDIRTHKDFHKYTLTERIIPPTYNTQHNIEEHPDFKKFAEELAKTKASLQEMSQLRAQSEKRNKALTAQLQSLKQAQGPGTQAVQHKLNEESAKLAQIKQKQSDTVKALQQANIDAVRKNPEYKRMARELKEARKKASCASDTTKLKELANNIYHGIAGLDSATIDNIILSKEDLSNKAEYQGVIRKMKQYGKCNIKTHPEYQKLVRKLNNMTAHGVDSDTDQYQEFKVQAHKCTAMFENPKAVAKNMADSLSKLSDAQLKALVANVTESKAATDKDFNGIVQRAQDEQYTNDPQFREFLLQVTREQIKSDPVYAKTVAQMVGG